MGDLSEQHILLFTLTKTPSFRPLPIPSVLEYVSSSYINLMCPKSFSISSVQSAPILLLGLQKRTPHTLDYFLSLRVWRRLGFPSFPPAIKVPKTPFV
jgi:hypothetical protein